MMRNEITEKNYPSITVIRKDCRGNEHDNEIYYDICTDFGCIEDLTLEEIQVIHDKLGEFITEDLKEGNQETEI